MFLVRNSLSVALQLAANESCEKMKARSASELREALDHEKELAARLEDAEAATSDAEAELAELRSKARTLEANAAKLREDLEEELANRDEQVLPVLSA